MSFIARRLRSLAPPVVVAVIALSAPALALTVSHVAASKPT